MKKLFGLLIGTTMMASIPVMADEQVLLDSDLDTVTASAYSAGIAAAARALNADTARGSISGSFTITNTRADAATAATVTATGLRAVTSEAAVVAFVSNN